MQLYQAGWAVQPPPLANTTITILFVCALLGATTRQVVYERNGITVTATPVEHYRTAGPVAYRLDWPAAGLSFTYSGGCCWAGGCGWVCWGGGGVERHAAVCAQFLVGVEGARREEGKGRRTRRCAVGTNCAAVQEANTCIYLSIYLQG